MNQIKTPPKIKYHPVEYTTARMMLYFENLKQIHDYSIQNYKARKIESNRVRLDIKKTQNQRQKTIYSTHSERIKTHITPQKQTPRHCLFTNDFLTNIAQFESAMNSSLRHTIVRTTASIHDIEIKQDLLLLKKQNSKFRSLHIPKTEDSINQQTQQQNVSSRRIISYKQRPPQLSPRFQSQN